MAKSGFGEPAYENYFYKASYVDLLKTIKWAFSMNADTISKRAEKMSDIYMDNIVVKIGKIFLNIAAMVSTIIFGTLFTVILSFVHIVVLLLFMCVFYVVFVFMWLFDRLYLYINQISNVCSDCKIRYAFPVYQCPNCKKMHWKLTPNKYGVLKRKCICGQKLPCTFFSKADGKRRIELAGRCPICTRKAIEQNGIDSIRDDEYIAATQESKPIVIPVGGGRSAGKSVFINAFVYNFVLFSDDYGFEIDPFGNAYSPEMREKYKQIKRHYLAGTSERTEKAEIGEVSIRDFAFYVKHKKFRVSRLLHMLDVDGESFINQAENEVAEHLKYCKGAVLIIDPFTIPKLYVKLGITEERQGETASVRYEDAGMDSLDIALDSFTEKIRMVRGMSDTERIPIPLAVCIGKVDMHNLEREIGDIAVDRYMKENSSCKSRGEAMHEVCKNFLHQYEEDGFLMRLENAYKEYRLFSFSSMGHEYGLGEYKPHGVMDIAEWIISMSDDHGNSKVWSNITKMTLN